MILSIMNDRKIFSAFTVLGLFYAAIWSLPGCSRPPQDGARQADEAAAVSVQQAESTFNPFTVYEDRGSRANHYIPSGFMPDGNCLKMDDKWQENCHSGTTCVRVVYDIPCSIKGQRWAGIYWLNPANNWGKQKGGFDLTGASKLTFWARGERGGERIEEFKMGGILGDFPDSDMAMIGPVILTSEWKEYSIDLRGKDLSYISGGFSWATNADVNPEECTFYLDDIRYE